MKSIKIRDLGDGYKLRKPMELIVSTKRSRVYAFDVQTGRHGYGGTEEKAVEGCKSAIAEYFDTLNGMESLSPAKERDLRILGEFIVS